MCFYRPVSELHSVAGSHCHAKPSICTHALMFIRTTNWQLCACNIVNKLPRRTEWDCWGASNAPCLPLGLRHLKFITSWLLTAELKSCFSPTALNRRVPDISTCSKSSWFESHNLPWFTARPLYTDLQPVKAPYAFSKMFRLKPLANTRQFPSCQ